MDSQSQAADEEISKAASSVTTGGGRTSIWRPYLFPAVLALAVIVGSLVSSVWVRFSENKALNDAVKSETDHLTAELSTQLDYTLHPLFQLGWRWNHTSRAAMKELTAEAQGMIEASPPTRSVMWLNRQ